MKTDLKLMWDELTPEYRDNGSDLAEIAKMRHSRIISKVLHDQKLTVVLYAAFLTVYAGLMIYAFAYLRLRPSFTSIIPLLLAGGFIFVKITSETGRLILLSKTAVHTTIKESALFFKKKVRRIMIVDFVANLVFFYLLLAVMILVWIKGSGGTNNLSWNSEPTFLIFVAALMLLVIPWLIRLVSNQRIKKLFSSLKNSVRYFDEGIGGSF